LAQPAVGSASAACTRAAARKRHAHRGFAQGLPSIRAPLRRRVNQGSNRELRSAADEAASPPVRRLKNRPLPNQRRTTATMPSCSGRFEPVFLLSRLIDPPSERHANLPPRPSLLQISRASRQPPVRQLRRDQNRKPSCLQTALAQIAHSPRSLQPSACSAQPSTKSRLNNFASNQTSIAKAAKSPSRQLSP
jgi:hypothetical protein